MLVETSVKKYNIKLLNIKIKNYSESLNVKYKFGVICNTYIVTKKRVYVSNKRDDNIILKTYERDYNNFFFSNTQIKEILS